jgi:hypothetical protein
MKAAAVILHFGQPHLNPDSAPLSENGSIEISCTQSANKYGSYGVFLFFKIEAAAILDLDLFLAL